MPAAINKAELLRITEKEFAKLTKLIAPLTAAQACAAGADNGPSIKDTIGHRAHWLGLFFGWYQDGQAGKAVAFPAPGYKWNELVRYNAWLRSGQAALGWADVVDMLNTAHQKLLGWIAAHDDAALYGGPMKGANNDWTAGRWAEAAGPSHYRSAAKYIRAVLKAQTA